MDGARMDGEPGTGRSPHAGGWPRQSLLGVLDPHARAQLLALGVQVRYPADRVLMRESDPTDFVLVLLDGVVKVTGRTHDNRDALLAVRMGGDLVGEFAALDGGARSATVTTCGPVAARSATRAEFLDCVRRNPQIAQGLNASVVAKLRTATAYRIDFTGCDVATRLARVLHQIAVRYGEPDGTGAVIRWPITQPELAALAGAAEPSVHKALRRLRESGVLSTGYRAIRIDDLAELHRIAFA
ncbi:Crp/Fnr family transcriptional regulator [Streptomycetaceae bacterium NBC_01309]